MMVIRISWILGGKMIDSQVVGSLLDHDDAER